MRPGQAAPVFLGRAGQFGDPPAGPSMRPGQAAPVFQVNFAGLPDMIDNLQ